MGDTAVLKRKMRIHIKNFRCYEDRKFDFGGYRTGFADRTFGRR